MVSYVVFHYYTDEVYDPCTAPASGATSNKSLTLKRYGNIIVTHETCKYTRVPTRICQV